ADAVNYGLVYYEYGTNGPRDNPYPIHTGIDIANPLGTTIRAAADGEVVFSTDLNDPTQITFQGSPSYGQSVFILHDFGGPDGQPVYTLYAHLQATLVSKGQRVKVGDPIALMGNTGHASGPHVHFEVRMGEDTFGSTYNPDLWLAPYVGHGTVAGRVVNTRGEPLDDVDVQLMSGGLVRDTTTTYVFRGTGSEVNRDPNWDENFLLANVPTGLYRVQAVINGETVFQVIEVREGETAGVELKPNTDVIVPQATETPITVP
ncbi:MAG: peptidoglycan DD-metalloendopeptidase family protein, partial [Anaerolineae bacterium]|nr:peptidoglycan DD-metalloendopeptidase family protein [Anaerolineae bacterium]